jgi:FMN phosphatase YigB (HAD superfamily)
MLIIFDLDDTLYDCTNFFLNGVKDLTLDKLVPFEGVINFLQRNDSIKILVTKGDEVWQNKKIDTLGLRNFFNEIMICKTDNEKMVLFQKAKEKFPEETIWCIGNRIDSEIRYGNKLGFKTVLIKHGKYKNLQPIDKFEVATHTINKFTELRGLI